MKNALFPIFLAIGALTSCNTFKNAAFLTNNDLIRFIELNEAFQDSVNLKSKSIQPLNINTLNKSTSNDFNLDLCPPLCPNLRAKVPGNCRPKGGPCAEIDWKAMRLVLLGPRINPYPNAKFNLIDNANGNIVSSTSKVVKIKNVASGYILSLPKTAGGNFGLIVNLDGKTFAPLQINRPAPLIKQ